MKRLIVNADDLGVGERRNKGVLEAHLRGIVTATSVIANGEAFDHAVALLQGAPDLDCGLHLNLSLGRPVGEGYRTLVDSGGGFFGKEEARRRADAGLFDREEVGREVEAQLQKLADHAIPVSHIDGHQHLHIYGSLAEPVARVAQRHGIRFIRVPLEASDGTSRMEEYRVHAEKVKPVVAGEGVDAFLGIALTGCMTRERILDALRELGEGVTEMMVHPGYADAPEGFSGPDREEELRLLTDPELREWIAEAGIELVRFRDLG